MKTILNFLKLTLLGGLLFVLPVILIFVLLSEVLDSIVGLATTVADFIGFEPGWELLYPNLYALGFLIVFSFLVGIALRTPGVKRLIAGVEKHVLEKIPGYKAIRILTARLGGQDGDGDFRPALILLPTGAKGVAFILEDLGNGEHTVFLPSAPTPGVGTVQVVPADLIEELPVRASAVFNSLSQWGFGLKDALAASSGTPEAGGRSSS